MLLSIRHCSFLHFRSFTCYPPESAKEDAKPITCRLDGQFYVQCVLAPDAVNKVHCSLRKLVLNDF